MSYNEAYYIGSDRVHFFDMDTNELVCKTKAREMKKNSLIIGKKVYKTANKALVFLDQINNPCPHCRIFLGYKNWDEENKDKG